MTDLLPCPFCGSTNLRHEFAGSQGFIECNECGTVGPCDERAADPICDYDAAYAAWNRRAAAQADGPAVPEGREPVSVVSEPSDREPLEEGPSLEEVEELCEEHCFNVEGYESIECLQGLINDALARWGTPNQAEIRSSLGAATAPLPVPVLPDDALIIEPAEHTLLVPVAQPVPEEAANPWKDALIDALVCAFLLNEENQSDPRRALHDLISWEVQLARDPLISPPVHPAPVPVAERLPEPSTKVLAHYFNDLGKGRTICAIWVPAKTRSDSYGDDDFTEYDEELDTFYWPEGWYEAIENWDDLGYVKVDEGEVIYWQPLPKWPVHALPLPAFWDGDCDKTSTSDEQ